MSTANTPLISIVLPTYNVEKYVERCIKSMQAQDDPDFEMIFVDDCGQDYSMEIVERHSASDSRIRLVRYGANKGTFAARHEGAKAAKGAYVFFVDPDDEIAPNAISTLRRTMEQDAPDLIITEVKTVQSRRWYQRRKKYPTPKSANFPDIMKSAFLDIKPWCGTPGKIYRRELLLQTFSEFEHVKTPLLYGEDSLVYLPFANLARKMVSIPEDLYWYHLNETSVTQIATRSKYIWRLTQTDKVVSLIEEKINSGFFSGPYAREAALRIKNMYLRNTRGVCLSLLQDANRNFAMGIFAGGGWRWAFRIFVFVLTMGKRGFNIWSRT